MEAKKWNHLKACLAVILLFVLSGMAAMTVSAAETISVGVTGTYGQTDARSMLAMINEFRTGSDAWCWNPDKNTKTTYTSLDALEYDYELEQVAMLRAMELAVSFDHVRPCSTDRYAWDYGLYTYNDTGENIAAGYATANEAFVGWQETNEDYDGQGHRRNMLNPNFTSVGIGHVYANGRHYWVQLFRSPSGTMSATTANNAATTVSVDILPSVVTDSSLTSDVSSLTVSYGDTVGLPAVQAKIMTADTWPRNLVPVQPTYTWTAANGTGSINVASDGIKGTGVGTASVTVAFLDKTLEIPVTVERASISNAAVTLAQSSFTYDGTAKTPGVSSVVLNGKTLAAGTDYTVSWSNNTNAGTATVTVQGRGNYQGTVNKTFTIKKANLSSYTVSGIIQRVYNGSAQTQDITVKNGTTALVSGTDYNVSYGSNISAGTASVQITGKGNYERTISQTFEIAKANMNTCTVGDIAAREYTGSAVTPSVTASYNSMSLAAGTDYDVSYTNNVNAGTAGVTLTGKGNYTGTVTKQFQIIPASISATGFSVDEIASETYDGIAHTPSVAVKRNGKALSSETDYTVSYGNNINAGTAIVTITGTNNYQGTRTVAFNILPISLETCTVENITSHEYTGSEITPTVTVKCASRTLTRETDFDVNYADNVNAGTASVTITGKGNYNGSVTKQFQITPASISATGFTVDAIASETYNGTTHTPSVTIKRNSTELRQGTDYTVSYTNNQNAGTASVGITGTGNYKGTRTLTFEIVQADLASCTVGNIASQEYTGSEIKPSVTVTHGSRTMISGTDFDISYTGNTNIGQATVTLTGKGNYKGTQRAQFQINSADISASGFTVDEISSVTYNGNPYTPTVLVKRNGNALNLGTDYTVTYSNNQNAGTATVKITGTGNYKGERSAAFKITPKDISGYTVSGMKDCTYNGNAHTQEVTVGTGTEALAGGKDYNVTYQNNQNAGTATVNITGINNYQGTISRTFSIAPANLASCALGTIASQEYTGSAITPSVTMTYNSRTIAVGTDYTVSYTENVNVGTASVTFTGKGNYNGSVTKQFQITQADISASGFTVDSIESKTYNGTAHTPSVTLRRNNKALNPGTDYTVTYANNQNVGDATVKITGKGNYKGERTVSFKILPNTPQTTTPDTSTSTPGTSTSTPGTTTQTTPGTSTSATPSAPGTSTPTPSTPAATTPAKGKKVTDKKTGGVYKITKAGTSETASVEYVKPVSSKATVKVPDTVVINGVRCKVTSIAANAFKNNKKLKKVTIGKYVTTIGKNAFYGCKKLTSVTLGKNVTTIGDKAFSRCTALKKITLPSKVKTIKKQAFYGCKNLKSVTVKTTRLTTKTVGSKAFGGISSKATFKVPSKKLKAYKKLLIARGVSKKAKIRK